MKYTPRTDAAEYESQDEPVTKLGAVDVDFARQLERELNTANNKIELLMSANADVARIAGERDAAEKRIKRLEAVVNDPHALWANWLRGDVKLPVGIGDVREYQDRIQRLEEQLMDAKNKYAVLVADVVLNEDRADRIKQLEDRIHRASVAFFRDGSDGQVASGMLAILEEERNKR